jgi:predicted Zn-dependent protease
MRTRWIAALIMAVLAVIGYFSQQQYNPVTQEKQHVSLSADQEIALGLRAAPELAAQYGGEARDPRAQALVDQVGGRIVQRTEAHTTPYRFAFHALDDDRTINAFALPGGQVFITEALLRRLKTPGELAGVLGHEIGHVVARHGAEHLAKSQLLQGLGGAAVIASYDPNDPRSAGRNAAIAQAITTLVDMRFGRQDELESDKLGVRFMAEAGYDPRSMIRVMEVLAEASRGGRAPEFFTTHPSPEHRIERIREAIRQVFPNGVPAGLQA